jgi:uncharacterized membrane protein
MRYLIASFKYLLVLFAVGGVVVSLLAWRVHNSEPGAADVCSINEHWDCGTVQHSRYAEIEGVPVAAMGVAGYTVFLMLLVFDSRRSRQIFAALAVCAMGFALYLSYIEDRVLQTWCLYCVISQGLIALTLLFSVLRLFLEKDKTA